MLQLCSGYIISYNTVFKELVFLIFSVSNLYRNILKPDQI